MEEWVSLLVGYHDHYDIRLTSSRLVTTAALIAAAHLPPHSALPQPRPLDRCGVLVASSYCAVSTLSSAKNSLPPINPATRPPAICNHSPHFSLHLLSLSLLTCVYTLSHRLPPSISAHITS